MKTKDTPSTAGGKSGRPRGSKTKFTVESDPIDANLRQAVFGKLNGKPGTAFADQLWLAANPTSATIQVQDATLGIEEAKAIRQQQAIGFARDFGEEVLRRVQAKDHRFLFDAAETIRRRLTGGVPDDPRRAALLAYVQCALASDTKRQFTKAELRANVPWPKSAGDCPGDRHLDRLIRELSVPMVTPGRPKR